MSEKEYVRKITMKSIGAQQNGAPKKAVALARIIGVVSRAKVVESDFGPSNRLIGQFEAVNLDTGEVFAAGQCFLPGGYDESLAAAANMDSSEGVSFGVEIGAKPAKSSIGWEYTMKPIVAQAGADPLAALRDEGFKQLPAPKAK